MSNDNTAEKVVAKRSEHDCRKLLEAIRFEVSIEGEVWIGTTSHLGTLDRNHWLKEIDKVLGAK